MENLLISNHVSENAENRQQIFTEKWKTFRIILYFPFLPFQKSIFIFYIVLPTIKMQTWNTIEIIIENYSVAEMAWIFYVEWNDRMKEKMTLCCAFHK